jgi:HEAT repeat protein
MLHRTACAFLLILLGLCLTATAASREEEAKKAADGLKHKDAKVRLEGLKTLTELGGASKKFAAPYIAPITSLLGDPDAKVRGAAADTLAKVDPEDKKEAIGKVSGTLKGEKDQNARQSMETALGVLGGESDDPALKKMALDALTAAREKATEKREQKIIQAARMLITGQKKKKD